MTPENTARLLSAERWARIEEVFHEARCERGSARTDALRRLCGEDRDLLAQVQPLLEADDIVNRPRAATEKRAADLAGRRAGNYQLDSLLGTGGMGSVYLAHRCLWSHLTTMAYILNQANRPAEAWPLAKESVECLGRDPANWAHAQAGAEAGVALAMHRYDEALPYLETTLRIWSVQPGFGPESRGVHRMRHFIDLARASARN